MRSETEGLFFQILGPLECRHNGQRLSMGGRQQERLLTALLLAANQTVPVYRLVDSVWEDPAPATAVHQVRKMIADLRRRIPGGVAVLQTDGPGYRMVLAEEMLDASLFAVRLRRAREALAAGLPGNAVEQLHAGLELWRGPLPSHISGTALDAVAVEMEEQRLSATEESIGLRLTLGGGAELVGQLRRLVTQHPMRERLRSHLMLALYRSARQAEALEEYTKIRRLLADELGIEPGPELAELHGKILRGSPDLLTTRTDPPPVTGDPGVTIGPAERVGQAGAAHAVAGATRTGDVPLVDALPAEARPRLNAPCSLPHDVPDFVGRESILHEVIASSQARDQVRIISLHGMGGAGKTTLAVHAAHMVAGHYPDGQLYVDLTGFSPGRTPMEPAVALDVLLRTMGVPGDQIPESLPARTSVWRVTTAQRRLLVLLDNVLDAEQVRPLLPAAPGCLVLITSRTRILGVDGAKAVSIDVFSLEDGERLLIAVLGAQRVAAEPAAARGLIEMCGRLPLALRVCASRLAHRPQWPLVQMTARLGSESRRLRELGGDAGGVAASLSLSYLAMSPQLQATFRCVGLLPGREFDADTAAAVLSSTAEDAEEQLEQLVDLNLLRPHMLGRYVLHDLLRSYIRGLSQTPAALDHSATLRLLDYYYLALLNACDHLYPGKPRHLRDAAIAPLSLPQIFGTEDATQWLEQERSNLLTVVRMAVDAGLYWHAVMIPPYLCEYLIDFDYFQENLTVARTSLEAADSLGDPSMRYLANGTVASALWHLGRFEEGLSHLVASLELAEQLGEERYAGSCLNRIGTFYNYLGELTKALSYQERALELQRKIGDRREEANALVSISSICGSLGNYERSAAAASSAAVIYRELGEAQGESVALVNVATAEVGQERPDEALRLLTRASTLSRGRGAHGHAALVSARLAEVHLRLGDHPAAMAQTSTICRALEGSISPSLAVRLRIVLGAVHARGRDRAQAEQYYYRALFQARQINFRPGIAKALHGLAEVAEAYGQTADALAWRQEAESLLAAMRISQPPG